MFPKEGIFAAAECRKQTARPLSIDGLVIGAHYDSVPRGRYKRQSSFLSFDKVRGQLWDSGFAAFSWLLFIAVGLCVLSRLHSGHWPAALRALAPPPGSAASPRPAEAAGRARRFCEDDDPAWCERALTVGSNASSSSVVWQRLCQATGASDVAAKCPRSCGLCALVLAGCLKIEEVIGSAGSCNVGEDVVGEVCANDGDLVKEGYCTWLPAVALSTSSTAPSPTQGRPPVRFACGHCADSPNFLSPERRAMEAQMAELRIEEDGREADYSLGESGSMPLTQNRVSMQERNDLTMTR